MCMPQVAASVKHVACVQNGDKVVYSKYAGTELKVQGGDFVLLKVRHISLPQLASTMHYSSCTGRIPCMPLTQSRVRPTCSYFLLFVAFCSAMPVLVSTMQQHAHIQHVPVGMQEEDVIGVLNSTDIAQLLPLGDRILVEVQLLLPSRLSDVTV